MSELEEHSNPISFAAVIIMIIIALESLSSELSSKFSICIPSKEGCSHSKVSSTMVLYFEVKESEVPRYRIN